MKKVHQKILMGILTDKDPSGCVIFITIRNGRWALVSEAMSMSGIVDEVLCEHQDWDQFIELALEFSDYVEE